MAPEQLRGIIDARSDQFALCVAIVEGLTGLRPEAGAQPLLPAVPPAVREVLIRCLRPAADARFASMGELAEALARAVDAPSPPPRSRRWVAISAILSSAVIAATVAVVMMMRSEPGVTVMAAPTAPVEPIRAISPPPAPGPTAVEHDAPPGAAAPHPVSDPSASRSSDPVPTTAAPVKAPARARPVFDPFARPYPDAPTSSASSRNRRPPIRPGPDALLDAPAAAALFKKARALEASGDWTDARAAYVRLEKIKAYADEALYREALCAFQMNDPTAAQQLAAEAAQRRGPFQIQAKFLYGDSLFRQGEYARAKAIYLRLRAEVGGDDRTVAAKKIAVCNRALSLLADDGIVD
jgi:TolA-binding protein